MHFRDLINTRFTQCELEMIQFIHREVLFAFSSCFSLFSLGSYFRVPSRNLPHLDAETFL